MYKYAIFDLDGTLLNTLEDLCDSANYALKKHGLPGCTLEQMRLYVGNGAARMMERAISGGRDDPEFDGALADFIDYYRDHCEIKTRPYEGVKKLLRDLKECGIKTAIVSNKPDIAVVKLRDSEFPDVTVAIGEKEGRARKPAPDMVNAAVFALCADKSECVYIGDSEVDVRTAENSGIPCISVKWGFRTADELTAAGAAVICSSPEEVFSMITKK